MLGGLFLIAAVALLLWLIARRRPWLARIGRAIVEEFATSARWYMGAPPLPDPPAPEAKADVEVPDDLASLTEAALIARLLDRTLTRDQYQHAMAELAADDDREHPMSVPPWH